MVSTHESLVSRVISSSTSRRRYMAPHMIRDIVWPTRVLSPQFANGDKMSCGACLTILRDFGC